MGRLIGRLPALLIALATLVLVPAGAQAADLYVDQDSIGGKCNDEREASSVTASRPWCTPARAISDAPEGATVLLRGGTYSNIRAVGVDRGQMLTLKAAPNETVTLRASGTGLDERAIYVKGSTRLRFEGFRMTGGAYVWNSSFIQFARNDISSAELRLRNVADALVLGNAFHDLVGYPRALVTAGGPGEPGTARLIIRANEFRSIEHDAIALYWRLQDIVVEDNYIHAIHRPSGSTLHPDALQIAPQSEGSWGALIVRRNVIVDYDQGLLIKDGTTRGLVLENNVIGSGGFFQASIYNAPNARITNNTIDGRLYLRSPATEVTVTNNVLRSFAVVHPSSIALSAHNLVDPTRFNPGYRPSLSDIAGRATFADALNGNYRLRSTSLGVDMGSPDHGAPSHDLTNSPRPVGAGHDIGAYELQGADGEAPVEQQDRFAADAQFPARDDDSSPDLNASTDDVATTDVEDPGS